MNAQQHHAEAERLLDNDGGRLRGERAAQLALVHAMLALSAPREINVSLAGSVSPESQRPPVGFTPPEWEGSVPEVVRTGSVSAETARDIEAWREQRIAEIRASIGRPSEPGSEWVEVEGETVLLTTEEADEWLEREPLDPELNRTEPEPRYDFGGNALGMDEHDWRL